ncbi:glycosyl transferase family 2 [Pseudarthrobacter chlorophenolicus A6]|uniref:Glycosyl transferase family 2 n=1 Tax=Pseudarthrobacter chlorophenolicus (strain ATCC 700700 / DSM 12829 / CIP 107037 / JCM 12360 / KCTC 9906 / NCIMB 13794 / A6) TaxID=452863 RepID=B8HBJ5_PSECP|nr:glycosyltransferase [Pseudarthrobacter chlorophenolicus]ACL40383.1 glycosyl transferase family 2 [Pseudarthrobacter chlorophenolicus A6]SDQ82580.1 Glycosyl transferase family 2 [Pseudarthrobacter chlorophenolicus]
MTTLPGSPRDKPAAGGLASSFGAVALAAYQPDEPLFARQLRSIQAQTHKEFVCLISVDGDYQRVADMVHRACGDDNRFQVLGYDDRLGFHHNFERALTAVPAEAQWVALSDQDDYWYPEKLATLLPRLGEAALVTSQARVVPPHVSAANQDPSNGTLTDRRNVGPADLLANNQVTGSLCIFRRDVLDLALPFPSMAAPSQYHDHWIGLCSLVRGGMNIENLVLQDYIQHGGNVVGESRQSLPASVRNTLRFVQRYEGSTSLRSISSIIHKTGLGWRTLMARTLLDRAEQSGLPIGQELRQALELYARPYRWQLVRSLVGGVRRGNVSPIRALEISLGIVLPNFPPGGRDSVHRS